MRKGQAFDTFKLMIAAVIAVAILGILLGILGGITTPGQSFDDTAKQLLTKAVQSPGAVFPSAGEVQFQKDSIFPATIFYATAGGRTVKFHCADSLITGGLCTISTTKDRLDVGGDFRQKIYALCGVSSADECCISVGHPVVSISEC